MASRGACPMCGYAFGREDQLAQTRGKCPGCGVMLQIPGPEESQGREQAKRLPGSGSGKAIPARPAATSPAAGGSPASPGHTPSGMPTWGWIGLAVVALAAVIGLGLFFSPGPSPPPPPAADDVKTAASLEEVLEAIVKFEVPMA
ncbi:MAG: hypothetical protein ABIP48_30925, partial [Planctomycetota bacterium]